MALDNHTLIFNLDKTFNLFNLSAKQFDTDNARSFTFQFIQNSTPFSLNGITVKVGGVKPDGKKIFNDVQIIFYKWNSRIRPNFTDVSCKWCIKIRIYFYEG